MKKTALITGATGGLGIEFAQKLAQEGYDLLISARSEEALNKLKKDIEKEYSVKVIPMALDLSDLKSVDVLYQYTQKHNLFIHTLINNAGFGDFGMFSKRDWTKLEAMMQVNILALVKLTHLYLEDMIKYNQGNILNVASIASFQAGPLMAIYYASKAFVLSFTESLSVELKHTHIHVSALCPGPTKTGFEKNASLETSGLFKNLKNDSATTVVSYGLNQLKKNKVIAIPGLFNKIMVVLSKFAPRRLVRSIVYFIQKEK